MSTKPYKGFEPKWMLQRAPENSYRSIFRWGDPDFFKYPKESLYKYVKKRCNLKDEEFMQYNDDLGLDPVNLGEEHAPKIDKKHVKAIAAIVGEKNVSQSDYDRLAVSYGHYVLKSNGNKGHNRKPRTNYFTTNIFSTK